MVLSESAKRRNLIVTFVSIEIDIAPEPLPQLFILMYTYE